MEKLRKIFTVSVMMMTIISMSVVVAPKVDAAASAGSLIKMSGLSSVYYLGADSKRYVFPNEQTYFSWYSDFSGVVTIPQSELESYPLGANVTMRPGTKLVKITTDPKVYAVETSGKLVWVPSEAVASALYGSNWSKRIVDVPDAFFTNYTVNNSKQIGSNAYPTGSLIKLPSGADTYYIDSEGKARKFANEASFTTNRFKWSDVVTAAADFVLPTAGTDITGQEATLIDTSSGAGGTAATPAGSGLTVALASDTPAAATILSDGANTSLDGQALVKTLKLNFTAASDGAVTVTALKLNRGGVSADSDIDNVYLYDGDSVITRLAAMQSISSKVITFSNSSGLFTVAAGTTKSIVVRFDLNREATSGKTISMILNAAADVTTNGAAVTGTFPITGNTMTTAQVTDFGGAKVEVVADNSTTIDPGTTNFTGGHFKITPSNQDMQLEYVKFQMIGSATTSDIQNITLHDQNGQIGGPVQLASDKTVTFDFTAAPKAISSSVVKNLYVKADVVNGSTRTFKFSIQQSADIIIYDKGYGIHLRPNSGTVGTFSSQTSSEVTINSGTITSSKTTDSPTGNIVDNGTSLTFGKFSLKATGEDIKVSEISYYCTSSDTSLIVKNSKILVDGTQVGVTDTGGNTCGGTTTASRHTTTTVNFTIPAGQTKYLTLVGDTTDSTVSLSDTISFTLNIGSSNGQRMSSLGTLNVPGASIDGNTLTVKAGTVAGAKNQGFGDSSSTKPTGVVGRQAVKIGSFTITAGAGEDVDITKVTIRAATTANPLSEDFQNLMVKRNDTGAQIGSTIGTLSSTATYNYEFTPTTNIRITNGQSLVVDVYADILTNATNTASAFAGVKLYSVTATGVSTASDASETSDVSGQNVYLASAGSLVIEDVASSDKVQGNMIYANSTVDLFKFKFTTTTEKVNVTRFVINDAINASDGNATTADLKATTSITNFELYDGTTKIAGPISLTATASMEGGNYYLDFNLGTSNPYALEAGTSKTITLKGLVNVSDSVSSGATHQFSLKTDPLVEGTVTNRAITARGSDSSTAVNGPTTAVTGNALTTRKAYPIVTRQSLPSTVLSSGSTDGKVIAKFDVTAAGGEVRLKQMIFTVTLNDTTTSTLMSLSNFKLYRGGSLLTDSEVQIFDGTGSATADKLSSGGTATLDVSNLTAGSGTGEDDGVPNTTSTRIVVIFGNTTFSGEETIGANSTNSYEIKCNIANAHQGATTDSDSIVVQMLGDDSVTKPYTANLADYDSTPKDSTYRLPLTSIGTGGATGTTTAYNFIWSDYSANTGTHTNTIPSTGADWTYGYQVRSTTSTPASYIPLDSWSLSKS